MSNLFTKLGSSYVTSSFAGSYFLYQGDVCIFIEAGSRNAVAYKCTPEGRLVINIPLDYFTSFDVFKHPPLGYRNHGNTVILWESVRSTMRGFRPDTVNSVRLDMGLSGMGSSLGDNEAKELFFPEYIPYHKGLASILNGERFAFAMNKDVAVRINPEAQPTIEFLFRGRKAGDIDENGTLILTNKTLRNSKTYAKLQGAMA